MPHTQPTLSPTRQSWSLLPLDPTPNLKEILHPVATSNLDTKNKQTKSQMPLFMLRIVQRTCRYYNHKAPQTASSRGTSLSLSLALLPGLGPSQRPAGPQRLSWPRPYTQLSIHLETGSDWAFHEDSKTLVIRSAALLGSQIAYKLRLPHTCHSPLSNDFPHPIKSVLHLAKYSLPY